MSLSQQKTKPGPQPTDPAEADEPHKTFRVQLRVTVDQKAAWDAAAKIASVKSSVWMREALDEAATFGADDYSEHRHRLVKGVGALINEIREIVGVDRPHQLHSILNQIDRKLDTLERMAR